MTHIVNTTRAHLFNGQDELPYASLPGVTIDYLLQYGWNKTLQDSVAGLAKKASELFTKAMQGKASANELKAFKTMKDAVGTDADNMTPEAFSEAYVTIKESERMESLMTGKMVPGGGDIRLRGIPRIMRDFAESDLKAAFKAAGMEMPDESTFTRLVGEYLTKNEASLKAKAEATLAPVVQADAMADFLKAALATKPEA